jgi:hypothetical protein
MANVAEPRKITQDQIRFSPSPVQGWLKQLSSRLELSDVGSSPFLPLIAAIFFYVFIEVVRSMRPLWHDELYTYYIANSPTLARFIAAFSRLDLNPPLQYVLTRLSLSLLGDSNLAVRIPFVVGFLVGSVSLYYFVQRKLGRFYGLTAMLVLWCSPFSRYAAEARPYALVLGFLGVTMLGWQTAIEGRRRRLGLLAIGFGVWGMLMSHCFSPITVGVIAAAELIRSVERRKIDWPIWISFAIPTPFMIVYLPLFQRLESWTVLPPEFQASGLKIIDFYSDLLSNTSAVLLIALVVALLLCRAAAGPHERERPVLTKYEIGLLVGLLSLPICINLFLMRSGGAFFPRYCIATAFGLALLFVFLLAKLSNGSRAAAAVAAACLFLGILCSTASEILHPPARAIVKTLSLSELNPELPLVAASGLTFLEMNKREDPVLLSRLFYLTDRTAAIRYAHATIFESDAILQEYFPIRGTVVAYKDFVRQSRHFLVLGTPDYGEDWLIAKLIADNAELNFKGELRRGYKDQMIFEVRMPTTRASSR